MSAIKTPPRSVQATRVRRALADVVLEIEDEQNERLLLRYLLPCAYVGDDWGFRLGLEAGEELLQFYERRPPSPSERDDPLGLPSVKMSEQALLQNRLQNGCLRLSPPRYYTSAPKRRAFKLDPDEVERILAWLPEARAQAAAAYAQALRDVRADVRAERHSRRQAIIERWYGRQALHFRPRSSPRGRRSGLAARVLRLSA